VELADLESPRGAAWLATKIVSRHSLRSPRLTSRSVTRAVRHIDAFAPDVAIVSELMAWPLARRLLPPGVPWVYDAHNVESRMFREFAATARGPLDRLTFSIDARRVAADEADVLRRADAVMAVSEVDARELERLAPEQRVAVVPSSVALPAVRTDPAGTGAVALFVGTLDYPPNVQALEELAARLWPAVSARVPEARLVVAGRRPSSRLRQLLEATPGVELLEDLPSLDPAYARARCAVLPLRSGSGTRLKAYEALAHGVPVVGTPLALTGLGLTPGLDCLRADTQEEMVAALVEVLSRPEQAGVIGAAGRRVFDERLSWERAGQPALLRVLDGLR
jgi:glycosyltransferase involved in cell wall biosynthesis